MIQCKKCGAELPDTANFCNVCGNSVEKGVSKENAVNLQKSPAENTVSSGQQFNNNQQFNNDRQFNNNQQFNNDRQFNNNQQFNNDRRFNNNQQFNNGRQAQTSETSSSYYGKQPYIPAAGDVQANKGISICAYLGFLWIIPLITVKNSPFTKFHTNQAILVFITNIVINIAVRILNSILITISWHFYAITGLLSVIAGGLGIALMVIGIVFAAQGKMKEIPVLGQIHILK